MQADKRYNIIDCTLPVDEFLNNISLANLRAKHPNNVSIAYLNINSVRNKFNQLKEYMGNAINILMIAETKLDGTFP